MIKAHGSGPVMTRELRVTRGSGQHDPRVISASPRVGPAHPARGPETSKASLFLPESFYLAPVLSNTPSASYPNMNHSNTANLHTHARIHRCPRRQGQISLQGSKVKIQLFFICRPTGRIRGSNLHVERNGPEGRFCWLERIHPIIATVAQWSGCNISYKSKIRKAGSWLEFPPSS